MAPMNMLEELFHWHGSWIVGLEGHTVSETARVRVYWRHRDVKIVICGDERMRCWWDGRMELWNYGVECGDV